MKPLSSTIIPALPEYYTVYDSEDDLQIIDVGEPVIAWRIETFNKRNSTEQFSTCTAITIDGDMVSNCIGIRNPDMSITVFENAHYDSLSALQEARYPKK